MKHIKNAVIAVFSLALAQANLVADSAVHFGNTVLNRMQLMDPATGTSVPVPTSLRLLYGVFANGSQEPLLPLGISSAEYAGIIDAEDVFIPGTQALDEVPLQVRGWSAQYGLDWKAAKAAGAYYGETDVRYVRLGAPSPSTIIWQSAASTYTNKFNPLIITAPRGLHIGSITAAEGNSGTAQAVFTVRLHQPNEQTVTVDFATQDGSAVAGQDYTPVQGTLSFAPGETVKTISVELTADSPVEPDESFSIVLSNPVNSLMQQGVATCLITEARVIDIRLDVAVTFHTVAGRRYAVERTSDNVDWTVVPGADNILGAGGPVTIHDPGAGAGGNGVRVYRTRLLSP